MIAFCGDFIFGQATKRQRDEPGVDAGRHAAGRGWRQRGGGVRTSYRTLPRVGELRGQRHSTIKYRGNRA